MMILNDLNVKNDTVINFAFKGAHTKARCIVICSIFFILSTEQPPRKKVMVHHFEFD